MNNELTAVQENQCPAFSSRSGGSGLCEEIRSTLPHRYLQSAFQQANFVGDSWTRETEWGALGAEWGSLETEWATPETEWATLGVEWGTRE